MLPLNSVRQAPSTTPTHKLTILAREEKQSRQKDRRHINYFEAASSGPEQTRHSDSQRGNEELASNALKTQNQSNKAKKKREIVVTKLNLSRPVFHGRPAS